LPAPADHRSGGRPDTGARGFAAHAHLGPL